MIRINLLPHAKRGTEKRSTAPQQIAAMIGVLIALAAYLYWQYGQLEAKLESQKRQLADIEKDIEEKKALIGGLEQLEKLREETKRKLDVVNQVQGQKVNPVPMLELVQSLLPRRVWLVGVDERAGSLNLKGVGANAKEVAEFMAALENSPRFSGVKLTVTESKANFVLGPVAQRVLQTQGDLQLQSFEATMKFVADAAPVAALTPGGDAPAAPPK